MPAVGQVDVNALGGRLVYTRATIATCETTVVATSTPAIAPATAIEFNVQSWPLGSTQLTGLLPQ